MTHVSFHHVKHHESTLAKDVQGIYPLPPRQMNHETLQVGFFSAPKTNMTIDTLL